MNNSSISNRAYRLRWWTLVVIAISVLIVVLDSTIVNVALPTLQRELNTTGAELQWIVNAYILTFAALMLTTGALGDRIGRKRVLQIGIVLFAGASAAAAFSTGGTQLIVWRGIMGIGSAMILPATLAIITNVFPREERGKAIGAWAGMNGIGIALGPIIGGLIVERIDWHWIFLINLPIVAIALALGWFLIPESRDPRPRRPDYPGTVISSMALAALVYGLITGGGDGWTDIKVVASLVWAVALLFIFLLWESRTDHPMLELSFFRNPRFSAGVGAVSLTALSQVGITFALTLYMQFVQGYTALQTGVRFVPFAMGIFIGAGSSDKVVKKFGTTSVVAFGFFMLAAVLGIAAFWRIDTPFWQLGLVFFGMGFFLGYIAAPATDAIMGALPRAKAGIGSAMNSVSRSVAGAVGVAALGSALASVYTSSFREAAGAITGLPGDIAEAAGDSVGAAVTIAKQLPEGLGEAVAQAGKASFMDGWQMLAFISCGITLMGALFVIRYMPARRDGGFG